MATEKGSPTLAKARMHLDFSLHSAQDLIPSDHDGSSGEELPLGAELHQEDAHSVIGVSIGKVQTRLTSPQTPAAEKVAALAELEGGGLFDDVKDEDWHEEGTTGRNKEEFPALENDTTPSSTTPKRQNSVKLPSPWRAEPKVFEKQKTGLPQQHYSEPANMLPDLNVRRYMASFNLPSLPKAPFREFSVPSLSSILSSTRSRSPVRKNDSRQKRASTLDQVRSSLGFGSLVHPFATFMPSPHVEDNQSNSPSSECLEEDYYRQPAQLPLRRSSQVSASPVNGHERTHSTSSSQPSSSPQLQRTTSDQSLLLRRVTSAGSSLGDDSRWENVQEQVNSRLKAIKDSLQDSSIKLPSLPNLSTMNLNSFRPDFTRNRAHSETKRPILTNSYAEDKNDSLGAIRNPANAATMKAEAPQTTSRISKAEHSYLGEALEHLTGDLVVLGGYRGSILRSAQPPYRQLWVPVKVGLNIRKVNLEVGLQPEDEENMHDYITASEMLSHIGPIDMGRRLLKRLRTCRNAVEGRLRIHEYGWDWRLSPHLNSRRLLAFLLELRCNHADTPEDERGATVIAHSMGGLITRHAINQRPELFAGVVYAGVPQHCVNILGPLRNGDEVLLSSKVLTAQVNFTLRSSFLLLPESGKCFIDKVTREEYPVNFFDVEHWKEYAWSPCIAPTLRPINPQENKSMLESVTSMLPSMPSLPLPGRKTSTSPTRHHTITTRLAADTATTKVNDLTSSSPTNALDPQFSPTSAQRHHTNPQTTIPLDEALTYLTRTLAATLAFKAEMVYDPTYATENLYPPLSVLYANNTPTVVAARVSSRDAIKRADAYDDLQFASGDGVCLARAAMLPHGYSCVKGGKVRTERGHVGLLGDLEAVGRCLIAVREGRKRGIGLGLGRKGE
ncbi:hypothetical protein ACLMJK_002515 [Lecanora helva]